MYNKFEAKNIANDILTNTVFRPNKWNLNAITIN